MLGVLKSILGVLWGIVGIHRGKLGVFRHQNYKYTTNFCLKKVEIAVRTKTSERPKTVQLQGK